MGLICESHVAAAQRNGFIVKPPLCVSDEAERASVSLERRGSAAFGRYRVNGIEVVECLSCGVREPVKTRTHKEKFRLKHNATCNDKQT